jgi:hypothetical protein
MKYTPQIIELADGTKCVALEDFRRECDEAKEAIRALAEHGESEIQRITKERDEARELLAKALVRGDLALEETKKAKEDLSWSDIQDKREMQRERDEARRESLEQARLLGISGEWGCKLIAERDELQKKYDKLATENMLEVNKICNERDAAIKELKEAWLAMDEIEGTDRINNWQNKNAHLLGEE